MWPFFFIFLTSLAVVLAVERPWNKRWQSQLLCCPECGYVLYRCSADRCPDCGVNLHLNGVLTGKSYKRGVVYRQLALWILIVVPAIMIPVMAGTTDETWEGLGVPAAIVKRGLHILSIWVLLILAGLVWIPKAARKAGAEPWMRHQYDPDTDQSEETLDALADSHDPNPDTEDALRTMTRDEDM